MPPKPPAASGSALKVWLVILGLIAIGAIALIVAIPQIVKQKCIDTAAEDGIALTIGAAQVGWGTVHLSDVAFAIPEVPQITGAASDVNVALSGLTPQTITALNVGITIVGSAESVMSAVDAWQAKHAKAPGTPAAEEAAAQKILIQNGHLGWTGAFGQVGKIDASSVNAETDGSGASFKLTADKTIIGTPKGDVGPWRMSFERDAASVRTRFELDPAMHDGPSIMYVTTHQGGISVKVAIPKSPLGRIGIPPALFGVSSGQMTQVEAQIALEKPTPTQASLTANVALLGAKLGAAPVAADVKLDLAAAGNPAKPLDISRGTLIVGPFRANVTGTLTLFQDGARLALAWNAQTLKCEEIAQNAARDALGEFGAQLSAFAKGLGVAKVTGEARFSGLITVDTRNLNDVSVSITAKDTCGIAVLP